jgi:hypothetical protein
MQSFSVVADPSSLKDAVRMLEAELSEKGCYGSDQIKHLLTYIKSKVQAGGGRGRTRRHRRARRGTRRG